MANDVLLRVQNLKKYFPVRRGLFRRVTAEVKAVDDVSFDIHRGETLGLVGESGCGKTTTGRTILRLLEPTAGQILFFAGQSADGATPAETNVATAPAKDLKALRRDMQIIYQDPFSSLNGRMTVFEIVAEPLRVQRTVNRQDIRDHVAELLRTVGLDTDHMHRHPHEFSGGQRQRIGIARALALQPQFVVADEPVSALDASIQAQVINLLHDLQQKFGLTYLFIAHDLTVVKHISDRVAVMYLGRVVELATSEELFARPLHPYTEALISAVPVPDPDYNADRIILKGDIPSPLDAPRGCHFHPRCRYAKDICKAQTPKYQDNGDGHFVACHFADSLDLRPLQVA